MQVPFPALGARIFKKVPTGGCIHNASVGGDGFVTRIRERAGLEVCEVDDFSSGGATLRRAARAQGIRVGV